MFTSKLQNCNELQLEPPPPPKKSCLSRQIEVWISIYVVFFDTCLDACTERCVAFNTVVYAVLPVNMICIDCSAM